MHFLILRIMIYEVLFADDLTTSTARTFSLCSTVVSSFHCLPTLTYWHGLWLPGGFWWYWKASVCRRGMASLAPPSNTLQWRRVKITDAFVTLTEWRNIKKRGSEILVLHHAVFGLPFFFYRVFGQNEVGNHRESAEHSSSGTLQHQRGHFYFKAFVGFNSDMKSDL